jgi:hypothetical protein
VIRRRLATIEATSASAACALAVTRNWPCATSLGQELAQTMSVPFYFRSPDTPDIDQLRWWDTLS